MRSIYPFTVRATHEHFVANPRLAAKLWHRDREEVKPDLIWYAVDLEVTGPASVTIHVHDMADAVYGGIGDVIFRYRPVLDEGNLSDLKMLIVTEQLRHAAEEHRRRKARRVTDEIEALRREMFGDAA